VQADGPAIKRTERLKMIRWIILAPPPGNLWWPKEGAGLSRGRDTEELPAYNAEGPD